MKANPAWLPQSFFARMLWLVLAVVLFSKLLTLVYLMLNEDMLVDNEYSHGAAIAVHAYWAVDPESRAAITQATGMMAVPASQVPRGSYMWPYTDIFEHQIKAQLGPETEARAQLTTPTALWIRASSLGPDWVRVPLALYPLRGQRVLSVLAWFIGIGLLSTAAAWMFILQLNAPLRRLVDTARQLGRGARVRLPLQNTPNEMTEVFAAFNQMAEGLEQAARERELMLAGVSHDLRTPLTRLRLSVELMGGTEDAARQAELEDMVRDIEDMNAILDQFLAFIRDGSDEASEDCDLIQLIHEVTYPYLQQGHEIRLCLEALPIISARRLSMKRLLNNLIENAQRYGGEGIEVAASLCTTQSTPYITISVLDRGPGVDPNEVERLFNPFTRGNQARGGSGSGLGLAIVRRIVLQHGGSIELLNRPGGGTEARLRLPISLMLPKDAL